MYFFLTLLLLSSVAIADEGRDFCFPTQKQAAYYHRHFDIKARMLFNKLAHARKSVIPTRINHSKGCDNCLEVIGDSYIRGVLKEEFDEKIKELEKKLIEGPVRNLKLDVSVAGLLPDQQVAEKVFFNKLYKPFMRYPDQMQNVFYEKDKEPIYVTAKMINQEVMTYTFIYKDLKHTIVQETNEPILCMFPYDDKLKEKYPNIMPGAKFSMKEDDKFLELKYLDMISIVRDFYWPQEQVKEP